MKIVIPGQLARYIEPHVLAKYPEMQIVHTDDAGVPAGDIADATVLIRWWYSLEAFNQLLQLAPNLKWVYTPSAGIEYMNVELLQARGVILTNAAGVHGIPIAEFVMMYILTHMKKTALLMSFPRDAWEATERTKLDELYGKTMAIIGLGGIGQETAKRASAFGMRVIGSRRRPQPTPWVDEVVSDEAWRSLLPHADVVVLSTPLTERTRGMFDADAFALMKPDAYLINVARGNVIDTNALIEALQSKRIAGAGLDVQPEEPLPPTHPLWDAPNVWITPHISASSPKTRQRMTELFIDNLNRFLYQQPMVNVVDFTEGY